MPLFERFRNPQNQKQRDLQKNWDAICTALEKLLKMSATPPIGLDMSGGVPKIAFLAELFQLQLFELCESLSPGGSAAATKLVWDSSQGKYVADNPCDCDLVVHDSIWRNLSGERCYRGFYEMENGQANIWVLGPSGDDCYQCSLSPSPSPSPPSPSFSPSPSPSGPSGSPSPSPSPSYPSSSPSPSPSPSPPCVTSVTDQDGFRVNFSELAERAPTANDKVLMLGEDGCLFLAPATEDC